MQPGCFYHIYNRGNNRQNIFFEERNYLYFLRLFEKYLFNLVDVYAYCLMPNHFHFLIKIKDANQTSEVFKTSEVYKLTPLQKAFKDFFISYSKAINKAYGRSGSLFQAKFKQKEIRDNRHLTVAILYIHANPVKAGLCNVAHEYKYTSYNALMSNDKTSLMRKEVLEWFGTREQFIKMHQNQPQTSEVSKTSEV